MSELNNNKATPTPFGIYIHWPFCAAKCPYCDFNSHVRSGGIDETRFVDAYLLELEFIHSLAPNRHISSIFFGGGTPSLMSGKAVGTILGKIAQLWSMDNNVEISLEANPTSIDAKNFANYRAAGVNRISIGVQAMNNADLRKLGRLHSVDEARAAVKLAQKLFDRISFDLIYARQNQSLKSWASELHQAIEMGTGHLSLYQLTIEQGTRFADLYKLGKIKLPSNEFARELYDITQDICSQYGLNNYEISNYAKPDQHCQHNLLYWRYNEYAGIGAGAHSRLIADNSGVRTARVNHLSPEKWLQSVEQQGQAIAEAEELTPSAQGIEYLLMCLRLREGVELKRFKKLSGYELDSQKINKMLDAELLIYNPNNNRIITTEEGARLTDYIIGQLLN